MKLVLSAVAALAIVIPSLASAAPAPQADPAALKAAKVLSVKASALSPRVAPVKPDSMGAKDGTGTAIVAVAVVAGALVVAFSGGGDSR
jgi:hypothetical protein